MGQKGRMLLINIIIHVNVINNNIIVTNMY